MKQAYKNELRISLIKGNDTYSQQLLAKDHFKALRS